MNSKRAFLIVADSLGVGASPDASLFYNDAHNDCGANTLASIVKSKYFKAPFLTKSGLLSFVGTKPEKNFAAYGKMSEKSAGKDTIIGHWELSGIVTDRPMPTYPDGFPDEIIEPFCRLCGRGVLCNKPYSGTQVIADYGEQHMTTGSLIVYTSADSVFQIAAHEKIIPPEKLYEYCMTARRLLCGENAVGRVIARPFDGEFPDFFRTPNRRDFSLEPHSQTMLDRLSGDGLDVIAVGKIGDIFAHRGITEEIHTNGNADGLKVTGELMKRDFHGLCFVNLVDFDMKYGHRRDIDGYAAAVSEMDAALSCMYTRLEDGDIMLLTADHGCDPGYYGTDHTREYVPLIMWGRQIKKDPLGILDGFDNAAHAVCDFLYESSRSK